MENKFLILLNLGIALLGAYICICRMALMRPETKPSIRFQYVIWFTSFATSGVSWLYDLPATIAQTAMTLAIVVHLVLGSYAWKRGAPAYTYRSYQ